MSDWLTHDGGGRPHSPHEYVEVRLRNGALAKADSACIGWVRFDDEPEPSDIMEYRLIERPLTDKQIIAKLEAERDALLAVLVEIFGPINFSADNPNVRDDAILPVDMTMGELRRARSAIAKATHTPAGN